MSETDKKSLALAAFIFLSLLTLYLVGDYFDDRERLSEIRDLQNRIAVLEQKVK